MANVEVKKSGLEEVDLYKAQERYGKFMAKKMLTYKIMFMVSAFLTLISMFMIPMYKYQSLGKKRGSVRIIGEYTPSYIIEKYFNVELGPQALFNTCLMIVLVVMIILSVYVVVGSVINMFGDRVIYGKNSDKILSKLFNYGMLEVMSTVLLVCLLTSMVLAKIDMSGNVENVNGFWLVFLTSVVMICTSIPLSDKKA